MGQCTGLLRIDGKGARAGASTALTGSTVRATCKPGHTLLLQRSLAGEEVHGVLVHHLQGTATAAGDAGQRVFGDDHRQAGFLG